MYMHIYHSFSEDFHVKVVSLTISQPHFINVYETTTWTTNPVCSLTSSIFNLSLRSLPPKYHLKYRNYIS